MIFSEALAIIASPDARAPFSCQGRGCLSCAAHVVVTAPPAAATRRTSARANEPDASASRQPLSGEAPTPLHTPLASFRLASCDQPSANDLEASATAGSLLLPMLPLLLRRC